MLLLLVVGGCQSEARVLQVDVWLQAGYACELFDSCRSTTIVGSVTGMQSGLVGTSQAGRKTTRRIHDRWRLTAGGCLLLVGPQGLLTYQAQTGAVGHGEFFFIHFDNNTSSTAGDRQAGSQHQQQRRGG